MEWKHPVEPDSVRTSMFVISWTDGRKKIQISTKTHIAGKKRISARNLFNDDHDDDNTLFQTYTPKGTIGQEKKFYKYKKKKQNKKCLKWREK